MSALRTCMHAMCFGHRPGITCRCAIAILAMATAHARGAEDRWRYAWELHNQDAPPGLVYVELSPQFVDTSAPTLADVRIVPATASEAPWDGSTPPQVPYMLHRPETGRAQTEEWTPVQTINRVYEPGRYEQIVLDFGEPRLKNQLKLELSGSNFRRRVSVEGSDDAQTWKMLREDEWLFDISQPYGDYDVDIVNLGENNFRYLRVTVHHMADDPRRIEILSALAVHRETLAVTRTPVPIVKREDHVNEDLRATDILLDLGYRNLPVYRIDVETETPYFYRAFEVSGRNAVTERVDRRTETGWDQSEREVSWTPVARGVFYRIREGERTRTDLTFNGNAPYRYLRLRIYHEDNPPLEIGPVTVSRRPLPSIIFENDPQVPMVVLSGSPGAMPPQFDLARSVPDLDLAALPVITMAGTPRERVAGETLPWTARNAWILWLALVLTVFVMAWGIWTNLPKMKQEAPLQDHEPREDE